MHCNNWIFDMDGTLTDSMTVVWEGAPDALLARYGRTPKSDLHKTLLTMGMADGAAYLIREYDLPLKMEDYNDVMWDVITKLYETVELKPGVRELLARLKAEGAHMCICSNTWSAQCRTVLTRLGIDEYFDFYVEAQGALHKSRPDVFFQTLTRLGGTDPDRCVVCEDSLYAARTPCGRSATSSWPTGQSWTGTKYDPCTMQKAARRSRPLSFCMIDLTLPETPGTPPLRRAHAPGGWAPVPRCASRAPRGCRKRASASRGFATSEKGTRREREATSSPLARW